MLCFRVAKNNLMNVFVSLIFAIWFPCTGLVYNYFKTVLENNQRIRKWLCLVYLSHSLLLVYYNGRRRFLLANSCSSNNQKGILPTRQYNGTPLSGGRFHASLLIIKMQLPVCSFSMCYLPIRHYFPSSLNDSSPLYWLRLPSWITLYQPGDPRRLSLINKGFYRPSQNFLLNMDWTLICAGLPLPLCSTMTASLI